ncbi:MAG TPA: class I SAM-dependent methyltransferase [Caulobacteraceae bacterium]|nr:class I SAM-dependent methyltransferase [Caulobacteraceae bacterium]
MTLEAQAPARNVQPHATSGRRSAFEKLRSFSRLNPRLAPPLARTMLRRRTGKDAADFAAWADAGGFEFTYDCVSNNIPFVAPLMRDFAAQRGDAPIRYLEIGAYEGRNIAFMDWMLPGRLDITAIDPWFDETHNPDETYHGIEARFRRNAARTAALGMRVIRGFSSVELPKMQADGEAFDVIYVDGSHTAVDVMIDMCFCANLLKVGGMMILDDYWHDISDIGGPGVKQAVDRFLGVFRRHFDVAAAYRQVVLVKTAELPR